MTVTKGRTTSEYRAKFIDPVTRNSHTISSDSLESLQKSVKQTLGNSVQFEPTAENSYVISLNSQHIGWLSQYQVPEAMSIRNLGNVAMSKAA